MNGSLFSSIFFDRGVNRRSVLDSSLIEFLLEPINSSTDINDLLFACEERMALRTYFNFQFVLYRAGDESVSTCTLNNGFVVVLWMYAFSHFFHLKS